MTSIPSNLIGRLDARTPKLTGDFSLRPLVKFGGIDCNALEISMGATYLVTDEEERVAEDKLHANIWEVAVRVTRGASRNSAHQDVELAEAGREEAECRGEFISDDDGNAVDYLTTELVCPSEKGLNRQQIWAVYADLCNKQGITPRPMK